MAFRRWKLRLLEHGILLDAQHERLANLRYADDMMNFAKKKNVGLQLNTAETNILTTCEDKANYLDVGGTLAEIVDGNAKHMYFGRYLPGNLWDRGDAESRHRVQAAWFNFHKHQKVLLNRHDLIKFRLKLFDVAVSPCAIFGMSMLPIHAEMIEKLDAARRKMLRKIVGWVRYPNEHWATTMRRMNDRVERALQQWPCKIWPSCL